MPLKQRTRPQQAAAQAVTAATTTTTPKQDSAALTVQQSFAAVKTLVDTSIGCIMYLRGIFPEDHFDEVVLPSGRPMTTDADGNVIKTKGDGSIKVKKLKRGCSSDGDRLLDYWEKGVQDVLEKEYLQSLIIAISLDPDDLQNIVEAYTFNFKYERIQGTKVRAPIMELSARLSGMDVSGLGLASSVVKSVPTAREVRASAQSIIRNLITMTQTLQELPRRRFITLKLIYNDTAPAEYQPPFFNAADAATHRFVFGTRTLQEAPEESSFGFLETGHHSVSVQVASLADSLPLPVAIDQAGRNTVSARSEVMQQEAAMLRKDAEERRVIWDAEEDAHGLSDIEEVDEESLKDAEGEMDPENREAWLKQRQDSLERKKRVGLQRGFQPGVPVGVRLPDGKITPMPLAAVEEAARREIERREGRKVADDDVTEVEMFVSRVIRKEWELETNSDLVHNVFSPRRFASMQSTAQPPTSPAQRTIAPSAARGLASVTSAAAEQHARRGVAPSGASPERSGQPADVEMETESPSAVIAASQVAEPSQTSQGATSTQMRDDRLRTVRSSPTDKEMPQRRNDRTKEAVQTTDVTRCACEDSDDDGLMIQCFACSVWVHATCYGFKDTSAVPDDFRCYMHRMPSAASPEDPDKADILEDLQWLALKRRTLHLMYVTDKALPDSIQKLAKKIGSNQRMATKIRNELEAEGFLRKATPQSDPHLFHHTASQYKKSRSRPRKAATTIFVVVTGASAKRQANMEYFDPGLGKEHEILSSSGSGQCSHKQETFKGTQQSAKAPKSTRMRRVSSRHAQTADSSQPITSANRTLVADSQEPSATAEATATAKASADQTEGTQQSTIQPDGLASQKDAEDVAMQSPPASVSVSASAARAVQIEPANTIESAADSQTMPEETLPRTTVPDGDPMKTTLVPEAPAQSGSQSAGIKRPAPPDFIWPGQTKKISIASAIEIQDESDFLDV